ncbi:MAG: thiamine phosphate synthase, partial [Dehalococcoidia bacterium]|nr:thiamine phosphate synthase [Dehalococcoidia bacterium]
MTAPVFRVLDANFDRCLEGVRVLEDTARFVFDDAAASQALRDVRHAVMHAMSVVDADLVGARRSTEDVGASPALPEEPRAALYDVVRANAKRAEEALRVLEEYARLPEVAGRVDLAPLKTARYSLYDAEHRLTGRVARSEGAAKIRGVYLIIDPSLTGGRPELQVAEAALKGGVRVLQWRDKHRDKGQQLPVVRELLMLCRHYGALLFLNDHPDLAMAAGADGVHVGQQDLPLAAVRSMTPAGFLIGTSNALVQEAVASDSGGADYLAVGAIYATSSKDNTRPAGLETL